MTSSAEAIDYITGDMEYENRATSKIPVPKLSMSENGDYITYIGKSVNLRFSSSGKMEAEVPYDFSTTIFSDIPYSPEEADIIEQMKKEGYTPVGRKIGEEKYDEYTVDKYDEYTQAYIDFMGTRNNLKIIPGPMPALVFAKIPHFAEIKNQITFSVDEKERKIIGSMKKAKERVAGIIREEEYSLVGQLNADGTHDEYVKRYIEYAGTDAGLRSRARNQKAVIPSPEVSPGVRSAETIEEVKNGGKLKNDGTAFIFAKTSEFKKVMEKMNQKERVIQKGARITGTDDVITKVGDLKINGIQMVEVNDKKGWVALDTKTGRRVIEGETSKPKKEAAVEQINIMDAPTNTPKFGAHPKVLGNVGIETPTVLQRNILSEVIDAAAKGEEGCEDEKKIMNIFRKKGES